MTHWLALLCGTLAADAPQPPPMPVALPLRVTLADGSVLHAGVELRGGAATLFPAYGGCVTLPRSAIDSVTLPAGERLLLNEPAERPVRADRPLAWTPTTPLKSGRFRVWLDGGPATLTHRFGNTTTAVRLPAGRRRADVEVFAAGAWVAVGPRLPWRSDGRTGPLTGVEIRPDAGAKLTASGVSAVAFDAPQRPVRRLNPRSDTLERADDRLAGTVTRIDETGVTLTGRLGTTRVPWTGVRGVRFAEVAAPPTAGRVRLTVRADATLFDTLNGEIVSEADGVVTLAHPLLGRRAIPAARVVPVGPTPPGAP